MYVKVRGEFARPTVCVCLLSMVGCQPQQQVTVEPPSSALTIDYSVSLSVIFAAVPLSQCAQP